MKKLLVLPLMFISSAAYAQAAFPTDKFGWPQPETTLAIAQSFTYELELDSKPYSTPLTVTCTGTVSPFDCSAPIPPVTPSKHTVRIRGVDMSQPNEPLIGEWSEPFVFTMRATPGKPGQIYIIKATTRK